jgi:hypothetical protein
MLENILLGFLAILFIVVVVTINKWVISNIKTGPGHGDKE